MYTNLRAEELIYSFTKDIKVTEAIREKNLKIIKLCMMHKSNYFNRVYIFSLEILSVFFLYE